MRIGDVPGLQMRISGINYAGVVDALLARHTIFPDRKDCVTSQEAYNESRWGGKIA